MPTNKSNIVKFSIVSNDFDLSNYFIKGVRVEESSELCDFPATKKIKTLWSFYPKNRINVLNNITYGKGGDAFPLSTDTLYVVEKIRTPII